MSASLEGLDKLEKKFDQALMELGSISKKSVKECALDLKGKAQELAPLGETGDLRGSASVKPDGESYIVGFEESYAVRQHEHTEYKHPNGGQAKYLEQPFRENIDKYINYIADPLKKALK
jgi:hypothetical protein